MANKRKGCFGCAGFVGLILALIAGSGVWLAFESAPTPSGPSQYFRFSKQTKLGKALTEFETAHIIKNSLAARIYASATHKVADLQPGTYELKPGMTISEVFHSIQKPMKVMIRLPEGWWVARTASRLEEKNVCKTADYIEAAESALKSGECKEAAGALTLDGFLYPDTYDLPPLTPAADVVKQQLNAFEKKVMPLIKNKDDLSRVLTIASMVELEASKDEDRYRIAGVIENRLKKGMRLELDATVLYAMQEWKVLPKGVVKTVDSPYNTYLHAGLPPGPIGSPSLKSIQAALNPEKHGYLYYVARPNSSHYFAATYAEHIANIKKARAERKAVETH